MSRKKISPPAVMAANTSKEYWEQVLQKAGLGLDAGTKFCRDKGVFKRRVIYVGDGSNVEDIYEMQVGDNGRVRPKGTGPDDEGSGE